MQKSRFFWDKSDTKYLLASMVIIELWRIEEKNMISVFSRNPPIHGMICASGISVCGGCHISIRQSIKPLKCMGYAYLMLHSL